MSSPGMTRRVRTHCATPEPALRLCLAPRLPTLPVRIAMSETCLPPPITHPRRLMEQLKAQGFAVLDAASVSALAGVDLGQLHALDVDWATLPPDRYLKDGGRYRRRRHACFVVDGARVERSPHRAHWQPLDYNALHGGMQRWFEPIDPASTARPAWAQLLAWLGAVASGLRGARPGLQSGCATAAMVCRGPPVSHRHHGRHRPADARRRAPRRCGPGGGFSGGARRRQGRRDARV